MVNFIYQLDLVREYPDGLFLSVYFWKWLALDLVDWVKIYIFTNMGRHHLIYWGSKRNKMATEGCILSFLLSWDTHIFLPSDIGAPGSWVFDFRLGSTPLVLMSSDSDWITSLTFLVLQLEDGRLWDLVASITAGTNCYYRNKFLYYT